MINIELLGLGRAKNRPPIFHRQFVEQRYDAWCLGLPVEMNEADRLDMPTIISIGGGKGGVGKSVISANLAAALGNLNYRVLVIDMDLGCSNLHTHFGVSLPQRSLADFIMHRCTQLRDVILPAPVQGVAFIAGGREEEWGGWLAGQQDMTGLWHALPSLRRDLGVDFVIFDLGAGTNQYTMEFFTAAHLGLLTVLPEPTSIENAYVFIKTALWKIIDNLGKRTNQEETAAEVLQMLALHAPRVVTGGYSECFRRIRSSNPEFVSKILEALNSRLVGIIINQTREQADIDIGKSMEHLCARFFGFNTRFLGHLNYDESVWKSLRNRRLFVSDFPHSLISKKLARIASEVLVHLEKSGELQ